VYQYTGALDHNFTTSIASWAVDETHSDNNYFVSTEPGFTL